MPSDKRRAVGRPVNSFGGRSPSDEVETVTFETETWLKLRDRDFIKIPETRDFKFVHFAEIFL